MPVFRENGIYSLTRTQGVDIAGFTKLNTVKWEGVPSCEVYLSGCNFRCPFCSRGEDLECGPRISEDDVIARIKESDYTDGVIITGGEPLVHSDLHRLLKKIKKETGKRIRLETNGSYPDRLDDILGAKLVDFVSMSIKAPLKTDEYAMNAYAIVDIEDIERSIRTVMDSGIDYEFRTTVVPIHITENDIESICSSIKGAECFRLCQFRPGSCLDSTLDRISPYKEKVIRDMESIARQYVKRVKVSGF